MPEPVDPSGILCSPIETPFGAFLLARTPKGLCLVAFDEERGMKALLLWRDRWEPDAPIAVEPDALEEEKAQLHEYLRGDRTSFELELDLRGTPFQLRVWEELLAIPRGATRTYGQLAERLGSPSSSRAVGAANGANPIPIVVPCHRVVARTGLGGFGGGLELKRKLLELEGVLLCSG